MQTTVGTMDFYFDMADDLEDLGVDFSLTVRNGDSVTVLSNVNSVGVARVLLRAQEKMFRERVNPNQDQEPDSDGPSTGQDI